MRRPLFRRVTLYAALIVSPFVLVALGMGGWALSLQLDGNIHTVEPNRLYRAAQLSVPELASVIDDYGIRTVVNLRGRNERAPWYSDEVTLTRRLGIAHIDLGLSATNAPSEPMLAALLDVLGTAEEPILVHCQSGADRTGLASALYELVDAGRPPEVAAEQLSFRFGHFPWLGSRTVAMDQTFDRVAAALASYAPEPRAEEARRPNLIAAKLIGGDGLFVLADDR